MSDPSTAVVSTADPDARPARATRALSLLQPWAWALFHAGKIVENREAWTRGCKLRGPIWIHASAGVVFKDFDAAVDTIIEASDRSRGRPGREDFRPRNCIFLPEGCIELHTRFTGRPRPGHVVQQYRPGPALARGAIVGRIDIVGVVSSTPDGVGMVAEDHANGKDVHPGPAVLRGLTDAERPWWFGGFALLLANPVPLRTPVPVKGMLGFWEVPPDVLAACEKDLPAAPRTTPRATP